MGSLLQVLDVESVEQTFFQLTTIVCGFLRKYIEYAKLFISTDFLDTLFLLFPFPFKCSQHLIELFGMRNLRHRDTRAERNHTATSISSASSKLPRRSPTTPLIYTAITANYYIIL